MKNYKNTLRNLLTFLGALLISFPIHAQQLNGETFSIGLSDPGSTGKLEFKHVDGSISVSTHDKSVVEITAKRRESTKKVEPKMREGMKSISNKSKNLEYEVEELKNTVLIRTWPNGTVDFSIKVPRNFNIDIKTVNNGDIYVEDVSGEFEVSNVNGSITMKNISGPVLADAMNEDIKIDFRSLGKGHMAFSNFNGDIDISFPGDLKAEVKAKAPMGDIFSDFEMKMTESEASSSNKSVNGSYKVTRNEWVRGTINGGGTEIVFQNFNGDILIRNKDK
ncbi:MAG: DUF4097 family beta strand repeat-containing protein [Bacteroidota bacterium]